MELDEVSIEELEEDEEWDEQVRLCLKIRATSSRTRTRNLGSNSPENVIDVSPRSRSPASDVSDSFMKNGISNDCTIMKHTSKESKEGPICHQCLKGERITLLICSECEETMYCLQCIRKWYPHLSEDDVVNKCPFCCKNCNCSKCLHLNGLIETSKRELANSERSHHLQYLIVLMLPFLNKLSHSQKQEIEIETKVQGLLPSEVESLHLMSDGLASSSSEVEEELGSAASKPCIYGILCQHSVPSFQGVRKEILHESLDSTSNKVHKSILGSFSPSQQLKLHNDHCPSQQLVIMEASLVHRQS